MEEVLSPFKAAFGAVLTTIAEFTDNHIFLVTTLLLLHVFLTAPPPPSPAATGPFVKHALRALLRPRPGYKH